MILFAILALGSWARLVNAGSSASLWFDEAWRIQRLLDSDSLLRQIVSPPNHIDPPLFSLAIYFLAQVHNTELVLRLVSIIPGVLSILLAWLVGRQLFRGRWLPLLSAFLIAFAPWTTIFSKELKPYSLGLLVHLAVVYGFLRYRSHPTTRSTALFVLLLVLALFFSTNIIFAYPGICILMLVMGLSPASRGPTAAATGKPGENRGAGAGKGRRTAVMIGACTALLAASMLYYTFFLHGADSPQSSSHLLSFWHEDFCPGGTISATTGWFFSRYLGFYSKLAFTDYSLFDGAGATLEILYPLMALAGAALVLIRSRRRFLLIICLFLMPVLVMIPFNLFEIWPFGPLRMNLFLMAYIVFPPLLLIDQWQVKWGRIDHFLPVGLIAVILMILQFPFAWNGYTSRREKIRQSAEALATIVDFRPDQMPIPLLINRTGMPSFSYYARHHESMSKRFSAAAGTFKQTVLADQNSRLYTTGLLLRQCQEHRQVAVYASHYNNIDRLLFHNPFTVDHHSFDGDNVHACILESEITGYEDDRRPLFSSKRFTGEVDKWKVVHTSPPLPLDGLVPGALAVVNFDLKFKSAGKSIRFRFIDQDGSGKPFAPSRVQNTSQRIPKCIETAVYTRIRQPVRAVKLSIAARGNYDFELKNVTCFATRTEESKPAIGSSVYRLRAGDRADVYEAVRSVERFWPDQQLSYGWTTGDSMITFHGLEVDPEASVLLLETFGWMPPSWQKEMNRNGLRVYLNGDRRARFLGPEGDPVRRYYFEIPPDIRTIDSIRILSNTFIPRNLGLNDDARALGIDVKSVQFPVRSEAEPGISSRPTASREQ